MATVMSGLATDFPGADRNRVFVSKPLVESNVGDLGPILIIVMSATALLLLLAFVNVANLLFARGAAKAREMALRAALGAGWGRLVRQLLTESIVLATAGTIVGVGIGALGLRALLTIGASKLPRLDAVPFDFSVLLFSLVVLVVTGAIIGLAPAVRLKRSDMRTLMNYSSRSSSAGQGTARWLKAMTVVEVALAIMLVAGAGCLVRGFANLRNTDAGFVTDKRLLFDVRVRCWHSLIAMRSTQRMRRARDSALLRRDSSRRWALTSSRGAISAPPIFRAMPQSRLSIASSSSVTSRDAIPLACSFQLISHA